MTRCQTMLDRRSFVRAGALAGGSLLLGGALAGCASWEPRSAASQEETDEGAWQTADQTAPVQEVANVEDELVLIEGGSFSMGSPADEPWRGEDETQHEVRLRDFYLAPRETTQADYQRLMGENPSANDGGDLPVESVTWYDAVAYCNALSAESGLTPAYRIDDDEVAWDLSADGYRLPTEAEWEYACRAGTATPFNTQTSISADEANYYGTYPYEIESNYFEQQNLQTRPGVYRQAPVAPGSFAPNAWGLFDMHGNVAEWVWDCYGPYEGDGTPDPTGPDDGAQRVNRGGGWNDFAKNLRSAYRAALPADAASPSVGFRVARNASAGTGVVGSAAAAQTASAGDETLVVFFSWGGNTRGIAQAVGAQTGFRVVELELEQPYSSNYNTVLEEAQRDQNAQARPALATRFVDLDRYGTVLLGYPNWWASIPMPIATFLESYDFAGKTIVPFCSHGGGRFGQSLTAISKLAPQARMGEGLSVHYSGDSGLANDISTWLDANGVAR